MQLVLVFQIKSRITPELIYIEQGAKKGHACFDVVFNDEVPHKREPAQLSLKELSVVFVLTALISSPSVKD